MKTMTDTVAFAPVGAGQPRPIHTSCAFCVDCVDNDPITTRYPMAVKSVEEELHYRTAVAVLMAAD